METSRPKLPKLTEEDITNLGRLYGLKIEGDDSKEVAVRLGVLFEEMENLEQMDLSQTEPIPIFLPVEEP